MADEEGKMNRSVRDVRRRRPGRLPIHPSRGHTQGKAPELRRGCPARGGQRLFDQFCERLRAAGVHAVETGRFGAMMDVSLVNDGPVTIVLER